MSKKIMGIYQITNLINNKTYIGSSIDIRTRWRKHKNNLRNGCHENSHLQNSWNKYGETVFIFKILKETNNANNLIRLEQEYLDKYKPEYNILRLASSSLGYKHTEETKQKLSLMMSGETGPRWGKHHTEETRKKISHSHLGKKFSKSHKDNISRAKSGKGLSNEHKKKLSDAFSGEKHPWWGKHHSDESKKKISKANSGEKCGNSKMKWEGVIEMRQLYNSSEIRYTIQELADMWNIGHTTAWNILNYKTWRN